MKRNPLYLLGRLPHYFHDVSDIRLGSQIGLFMLTMRNRLDKQSLPAYLQKIHDILLRNDR